MDIASLVFCQDPVRDEKPIGNLPNQELLQLELKYSG